MGAQRPGGNDSMEMGRSVRPNCCKAKKDKDGAGPGFWPLVTLTRVISLKWWIKNNWVWRVWKSVDDEEAMEMPGDIPIKECSCGGSRRRQQ